MFSLLTVFLYMLYSLSQQYALFLCFSSYINPHNFFLHLNSQEYSFPLSTSKSFVSIHLNTHFHMVMLCIRIHDFSHSIDFLSSVKICNISQRLSTPNTITTAIANANTNLSVLPELFFRIFSIFYSSLSHPVSDRAIPNMSLFCPL